VIAFALRVLPACKQHPLERRLLHDLSRIDLHAGTHTAPESRAAECAQQASRIIRAVFNNRQQGELALTAYMQGLSTGFYDLAEEGIQSALPADCQGNGLWPEPVLRIGYRHGCTIRHSTNSPSSP